MKVIEAARGSLREWHRRIEWLTGPSRDDRQTAKIWDAASESAPGRLFALLTRPFINALPHSRATQSVRRIRAGWRHLPPGERMRLIGTAVVVAVAVHAIMTLARGAVGWWWVLLPGVALTFGCCALVLSFASRSSSDL